MHDTLEATLRPSRIAHYCFLAVLVLLALSGIMADVGWLFRAGALIYIALAGYHIYCSWVLLRGVHSASAIRFDGAHWWLCGSAGEWTEVDLCLRSSVITARVMALKFTSVLAEKNKGCLQRQKTYYSLILEDSACAEVRRQLRLRLLAARAKKPIQY